MASNFDDKNFLFGTIDRFEGNFAVIILDSGQEILWPEERLPHDVKEGQVLKLSLHSSKNEQGEREKLAKAILSEILKIE